MSIAALLGWREAATRHRFDSGLVVLFGVVLAISFLIVTLLVVVVWLSFLVGDPGDAVLVYSWLNYIEVFFDSRTYTVVLDTLGFAFVTLVVAMAIGLPAAWIVERTDFRGKTLLSTLMTIGLLIPGFATAMGWLFLLHPRIGILNSWIMELFGLRDAPLNISTVVGMGWVQGLNLAPVGFIMSAVVFRAMDFSLEEAAQTSGANYRDTLRRITIPLAWPGILAASIYIFAIGFAAFDVPAIIGWGNRIFMFSTYVVLQINPEDAIPRYGAAAALSAIVIGLAGLAGWWYATMQRHAHKYQVVTGKAYRPRLIMLGRMATPVWCYVFIYFALGMLVPILLLMWASALPYFQLPSARAFASLSWDHYEALPWDLALDGLRNTGILMVATPTLTVLASLAFSWIVLRTRLRGRSFFDFIAFLPHAVPHIVFGVGALLLTLYVVQSVIPIYGTIWVLLLVFVLARISYGTRMTNSGLIQIHHELEESAYVSGAGTLGTIWSINLPLLAPTLLYAWLWIALLTYRELTLAVMLSTRDNITLPIVIWGLWQGGGLGEASALVLIMLTAMIPVVALYWFVTRRMGPQVA